MLDKFEIAKALREISLLLELKKENPYKIRAYATGASAVESIGEDIADVIQQRRLTTIRGIGDTLAAQINELFNSGSSPMLENLREEMPAGVIELSQVPGLSIKKIKILSDELGIKSIPELEAACKAGLVSNVKGFGKKSEIAIIEAIALYETRESEELLLHARDTALRLTEHFDRDEAVSQFEITGSVRRWTETVRNINALAAAEDFAKAIEAFEEFPLVTRIEKPALDKAIARTANGAKVYFKVVKPNEFAASLLYETGSREHFECLKELAHQRGYTLNQSGLYKGDQLLNAESEADIYGHLGLPFFPPEVRENIEDVQAALAGDKFEDLIDVMDIQGMTHCHTIYSDGKATVEEMVLAADALGMKYITITDHSPTAHYAGGVEIDRLKRQWEEIEKVQEKIPRVKILRGTESDILADGALDYPDAILEQFDVIIASVHSRMKMDKTEMTKRIVNCMKLPQFKVWGHALGRLLLRREPFQCDVEQILDVIAESKAAIEVNGDPHRLDMAPNWIREARKRKIPFIISVDAHSTRALNYVHYGVHIARRGGLRKHEILNALPPAEFAKRVKPV